MRSLRSDPLFVPGVLFGAGLAVSGMTDPAKVIGFLDFTGAWDPSLALVMAGALAVFAPLQWLVQRRSQPILGGAFPGAPDATVDARLVAGAAVFGIGWGLAGFCPGPAIANLGALRVEAIVFCATMVAGMWVAQRVFGADR